MLLDAATDVNHALAAGSPGMGALADMASALAAFTQAHEMIGQALGEVHRWVCDTMESNDQDVPGVGHLHRDWSKARSQWSHEPLKRDALEAAKHMTAPHAVDPETGEMTYTWDQAVRALDALYHLAGYNARVTEIRRLGLDVSDYATEGKWQPKVTITPEAAE